jgi:hypothetical protein
MHALNYIGRISTYVRAHSRAHTYTHMRARTGSLSLISHRGKPLATLMPCRIRKAQKETTSTLNKYGKVIDKVFVTSTSKASTSTLALCVCVFAFTVCVCVWGGGGMLKSNVCSTRRSLSHRSHLSHSLFLAVTLRCLPAQITSTSLPPSAHLDHTIVDHLLRMGRCSLAEKFIASSLADVPENRLEECRNTHAVRSFASCNGTHLCSNNLGLYYDACIPPRTGSTTS